jgi:hypothetical protein
MEKTMRISILKLMVFTFSCIIIFHQNSGAYDNKIAHKYINEKAIKEKSVVDGVLITSLGLKNGIDEKIVGMEIWEWIREGGFVSIHRAFQP